MDTVLVTGATGHLGQHVVNQLLAQGRTVRALTRRPEKIEPREGIEVIKGDLRKPETLEGICEGVQAVIACAGATLDLKDRKDRASYMAVDFKGNLNLLEQAQLERIDKFVYVSLASAGKLLHTEYAKAHEYFVNALEASGLTYTVVRPTGFFYIFLEILNMAKQGRGVVVGSGSAKTNPIHEADVATACIEALAMSRHQVEVGGPEVYTRREIMELAFNVLDKPAKIMAVPGWMVAPAAGAAKLFNPRLGALIAFGAAVGQVDVVAPKKGTETLRSYFEANKG